MVEDGVVVGDYGAGTAFFFFGFADREGGGDGGGVGVVEGIKDFLGGGGRGRRRAADGR